MKARLALILMLFCTPALGHDANHPELNSWFDHLASGKDCAVRSRMALRSPIQTGNPKTAITASVSTTSGSTFLTTP